MHTIKDSAQLTVSSYQAFITKENPNELNCDLNLQPFFTLSQVPLTKPLKVLDPNKP